MRWMRDIYPCADPERERGGGAGVPDCPHPGKSQVAIGFLRNTGTERTPLEKQLAFRYGRSVRFVIQGGQSRDTHVVISHVLFTFCARFKVSLTIIVLFAGSFQK